ncbi:MAG: hypothetical protein DRP52_01080 [Planctomycetota bacterium]|nr:MAG: hypothetical protein DRP52_01080 [Planctomycetota bacterium]
MTATPSIFAKTKTEQPVTALIFNCTDYSEFERLEKVIENSIWYGEPVDGWQAISFPVEGQSDADATEIELQKLLDEKGINGYFETE